LGVHPATLRDWADKGIIPSFRTAGGHRRFSPEAIETFLITHSTGLQALPPLSPQPVVQRALEMTRERLPHVRKGAPWYERFDEATRERKRMEGRRLFALAIQYVVKPEEREHILAQARDLGYRYGLDSVRFGVSLVDTLKAIMFFRQALIDTLAAGGDNASGQTAANYRISQGVDEFTQEVMYATAQGFEDALRRALTQGGKNGDKGG